MTPTSGSQRESALSADASESSVQPVETDNDLVSLDGLDIAFSETSDIDSDIELLESVRAIQEEFERQDAQEDVDTPKHLLAFIVATLCLGIATASGFAVWTSAGPQLKESIVEFLQPDTTIVLDSGAAIASSDVPIIDDASLQFETHVEPSAQTDFTAVEMRSLEPEPAAAPENVPSVPEMPIFEQETESAAVTHEVPTDSVADRLFELVRLGDLNGVRENLRADRSLANALDDEGRPMLAYANTAAMAEVLIEAGAEHELPSTSGRTPLMWIAHDSGSIEVAQFLIERGAWVSIEDDNGTRPIHEAASAGNHELVELLVEHGADIDALDDNHATPLHAAAHQGDLDGARLYIALGADRSMRDKTGSAPHVIAQELQNAELAAILDPTREITSVARADKVGLAGLRELKFSESVNLGTVFTREWGSDDRNAWKTAGSAWGTVSVPIGQEVMVMVNLPRLTALADIDPEGIQFLHIREATLDDEQIESLHHLTGLRRLTLSGSLVSEEAVESLRKALPECDVRD